MYRHECAAERVAMTGQDHIYYGSTHEYLLVASWSRKSDETLSIVGVNSHRGAGALWV